MPPGISSQLQLPVSRRVWTAKVGLVVALDVALAATGVGLIVAARARKPVPAAHSHAPAPVPSTPDSPAPSVEVSRPKVVRKGRRKPPVAIPPTANATPIPTPTPTPTPTPIPETRDPAPETPAAPQVPPSPPEPAAAPPDAAVPPPDDGRADRIADSIREVVEDHRGQIDRCYERVAKAATRTDPLHGTVTVSLTLQPSGAATDVRVAENDTGSSDLAACLAALLESWKFPSPGDEPIEFLWPFVFRGQ